jgi:hypothetical protein
MVAKLDHGAPGAVPGWLGELLTENQEKAAAVILTHLYADDVCEKPNEEIAKLAHCPVGSVKTAIRVMLTNAVIRIEPQSGGDRILVWAK